MQRALGEQDRALGRLLRGLEDRGSLASTTLMLVSDHGMAAVERSVDLAGALRRAGSRARVLGAGGFAILSMDPLADAKPVLSVARGLGLEAHLRESAPPALRLGNPRFGTAVALAPPGTAIRATGATGPAMRGSHGYRPEVPAMGALFLALGRGVRPGTKLGAVRAIDVAPTVLALLGIEPPPWMEGAPIGAIVPSENGDGRAVTAGDMP